MLSYIIVWKSKEQGGISGGRIGIRFLCFHSRQNWLLGLFKERLEDHMVIVRSLGIPN